MSILHGIIPPSHSTLALMDQVAGAGLSGAQEAPGFRAGALQPRPPINPLLTEHTNPETNDRHLECGDLSPL